MKFSEGVRGVRLRWSKSRGGSENLGGVGRGVRALKMEKQGIRSSGRWMQPALVCFGSWQAKISLVPISRSVRHKIRVAVQPPFCARDVC